MKCSQSCIVYVLAELQSWEERRIQYLQTYTNKSSKECFISGGIFLWLTSLLSSFNVLWAIHLYYKLVYTKELKLSAYSEEAWNVGCDFSH